MSDFRTILTDTPLSHGSHNTPADGACVMEKVAILWALHEGRDVSALFSDLPECTNQVIAKAAQTVNDRLNDTERQKLNAFIPRLLRARRTGSDMRINVRLAVWSARRVLHLVRDEDRAVCQRAIDATVAWLAGEASTEEVRAANAAANAAAAYATAAAAIATAYAANATAYAANAAANAANAAANAAAAYATATAAYAAANAAAANAAAAAETPLEFLDALLDAWEEAVTKEGEDLYVPRAWEDDALAFVSEYMVDGT